MLRGQRRRRIRVTALAATLAFGVATAAAPFAAWAGGNGQKNGRYEAGDPGVGDPYFPLYGNGGYQVRHYLLDLKYQPDTNHLSGGATLYATATNDLYRFNLDFVGLTVHSITINGKSAEWERTDHELVVTPQRKLKDGERFRATIRYEGVPTQFSSPALGSGGFFHTDDGAVAIGEPQVAARWYPVNDHPQDKATYTFNITVPEGLEAVSNGRLLDRDTDDGWTTWRWVATEPMASYLATTAIGEYDIRRRRTDEGLPVVDAVDSDLGSIADNALAKQEEVLTFLEATFGEYPFHTVGGIVAEGEQWGYALENQTRPIYSKYFFQPGANPEEVYVVVHELAHQWYGDSVAVQQWDDIWLNEGFATYAEWLWSEHTGQETPQEIFDSYYHQPESAGYWNPPTGDPGAKNIFDASVYIRGAMTLQALRMTVGDEDFFAIVRSWYDEQRGGNGSTKEFVALAERVSGEQLDELFQHWLFESGKPPYPDPDATLTSAQGGDAPLAVRSLRHRLGHDTRS